MIDTNLIWTWFSNFFGLFAGVNEIYIAAGLALLVVAFIVGMLRGR